MTQTSLKLANGIEIPQFGLGVYLIKPGEETENAVKTALKLGYRHIDTAHAYQNERSVGKAMRESGLDRKKIWLTSKLWVNDFTDPEAIDKMLARLELDYIDLVLLHQQVGDWKAGYQQLETAYKAGKVRSIGISNFDGERLAEIYDWAEIKPQVIQVETHPYYQQKALRDFVKPYGTVIEAWSPLGQGDKDLFEEDILVKLAEKYNKSAAQIILRWHIQEKIVVFPKSTSEVHLSDNLNIFDFELTDAEMDAIRSLDRNKRYFNWSYEEQEERFTAWKVED